MKYDIHEVIWGGKVWYISWQDSTTCLQFRDAFYSLNVMYKPYICNISKSLENKKKKTTHPITRLVGSSIIHSYTFVKLNMMTQQKKKFVQKITSEKNQTIVKICNKDEDKSKSYVCKLCKIVALSLLYILKPE